MVELKINNTYTKTQCKKCKSFFRASELIFEENGLLYCPPCGINKPINIKEKTYEELQNSVFVKFFNN